MYSHLMKSDLTMLFQGLLAGEFVDAKLRDAISQAASRIAGRVSWLIQNVEKSKSSKPVKGRKPKAEVEQSTDESFVPLLEVLMTSLCCEIDDIEVGDSTMDKIADSRSRIFNAFMWLLQRSLHPNALSQVISDTEVVQGLCDMLEEAARDALGSIKQLSSGQKVSASTTRASKAPVRQKKSSDVSSASPHHQSTTKRTNRFPTILLLDKCNVFQS